MTQFSLFGFQRVRDFLGIIPSLEFRAILWDFIGMGFIPRKWTEHKIIYEFVRVQGSKKLICIGIKGFPAQPRD